MWYIIYNNYTLKKNMNKINNNLRELKQSSTLAINEVSKELELKGKEIYKLGLGQSPFPNPKIITNLS